MESVRRWGLVLQLTLGAAAWLSACGGRSGHMGDADVGDASCAPLPCPSSATWDSAACACVPLDSGAPVSVPDADATTETGAAPVDATVEGDTSLPDVVSERPTTDGPDGDATYPDQSAPEVSTPDTSVPDVSPPGLDSGFEFDEGPDVYSFYDAGFFCGPLLCGEGFAADQNLCTCVPCAATCPTGQAPGSGCTECVACTLQCPAEFDYGPNCTCIPRDAGPNPPPPPPPDAAADGGVSCLLEGNHPCSAGAWCPLGTCPDNTTQYGCYCNHDGTSSCGLSCPKPPDCDIPGAGTCPYGSECVYGSCTSDPTSDLFVCNCESGGSAYCFTTSCTDGGAQFFDGGSFNPSDAGTGCLLEGFYACSVGTFCPLGTCPDGTTQYGCTCNADGTTDCNLTCPPAAPCVIPGEGTCPSGSQCTYGACNGTVGSVLTCSCYAGNASCVSNPCG